jgi:hypothetical protein
LAILVSIISIENKFKKIESIKKQKFEKRNYLKQEEACVKMYQYFFGVSGKTNSFTDYLYPC